MENCGDYEVRQPIRSVDELKKLASNGRETFFILLNFGVMSVKNIEWNGELFSITNEIDDSYEELTDAQLATETNIVKAIEKSAFFKY